MGSHGIQGPQEIRYGFGTSEYLAEYADSRGFDRALFVTDENLVRAGVTETPKTALESIGVAVEVFDGVHGEPTLEMVQEARTAIADGAHELVVGIGGGSSMDTAKVAAALADSEKSIRDVLGMGQVATRERSLALLPTTAGTGSEVTHIGVFADQEAGGTKKVVYADPLFGDIAIVDPDLTESLPQSVAAETGMDALTHAIECFVSGKRSPYTDILARNAIERIGGAIRPAVLKGAGAPGARYDMSLSAMVAGRAFVNSGLGAVHALTYPLSKEYHLGHGLTNALLLPYVMAYNLPADRDRYSEIGRLLRPETAVTDPRGSVEAVFDILEDIGIPTNIGGYGELADEDFDRFADVAFEQSKHNIDRNPRTLDREDVVQIFRNAYDGRPWGTTS